MFDVEAFYLKSHSGEEIDENDLLQYIKSFNKVVLWGIGNLGIAVAKKLNELGIEIDQFWDKRYEEIKEYNGVQVVEPFSADYNKSTTLVISCIVNGSLGENWTKSECFQNGYLNFLFGMSLYEAIICPLSISSKFDVNICTQTKACSLCNCQKYSNLIKNNLELSRNSLTFQIVTFIITNRCSLQCIHCGQRLLNYNDSERVDFDKDNIKRDIELFLDAVDFVGMVSIIGGEPFLHPDLVEIVNYCLNKTNFGVVNITTNGICKITPKMLSKLKNDRVKISFSYYDKYLDTKRKQLINENIELVKASGIACSVAHPLWVKPQEIRDYKYNNASLKSYKSNCESIKMCVAVKNGKFLPCSNIENIEGLDLYNIDQDYVIIEDKETEMLREEIIKCLEQDCFKSCRYCGHAKSIEIQAGEQQ